MQQVLLNLCHNAIDAMEETGGTPHAPTQVEGS